MAARAARQIASASQEPWSIAPALPGDEIARSRRFVTPCVDLTVPVASDIRQQLQRVMWERVSLRRDAEGLTSARETLRALAAAGRG